MYFLINLKSSIANSLLILFSKKNLYWYFLYYKMSFLHEIYHYLTNFDKEK